ncbi:hypothetical protein ACJ6WF_48600 [Streptomyces sp. MMS24-I2-30]|uniref:hypothetical protein n=1 Tax=Streptomyces sp. MMS24-I2-30 TaxID=3351564 RepID=UPI003896B2A0
MQNPGSPLSLHCPDSCVVLAGQAVEPAAGEAGNAELLADGVTKRPEMNHEWERNVVVVWTKTM